MTEAQKEAYKKTNKERMAAFRLTPEYQVWLEKSRELRRELKAKYRREAGVLTRDERKARAESARKRRLEEKRSAVLHDAHVRLFKTNTIQYKWRYANDPEFALKERIRRQITKKSRLYPNLDGLMRAAIVRDGSSNQVEAVCGYSIAELMRHLEKQFTKGMSWELFKAGRIHIDHIIPQASFDLNNASDVSACWALSNLRPLLARDNLVKQHKVTSLC